MIRLPAQISDLDLPLVVSVSGGKDSTACMIALREAGLPFRAVFADTGWEAPETYAYLDTLRAIFGPIDVVRAKSQTGAPGGMPDRIRHRASFPARMQRWCTAELKVQPLRAYHDAIGETVSVVGVRSEESAARRSLPEIEDSTDWGGWVWRPLIVWSEREVYEAHVRAGVPLNPLYARGHTRVGCWPCIHARKNEIRLLAEHDPARIDEIAALESWATEERARRNAEEPGRYSHPTASFFQYREGRESGAQGIREVVGWSRTSRGGKQLPLLVDPPSDGCFRWGLCEAPGADEP